MDGQPVVEYAYTISPTAANAVETRTLKQNGDYRTTYALYDGLLRERQTQAPATGTKNRIMTETHYDTRGWASQAYSAYYASGVPSAKLESAAVNTIPAATQNIYDGMGRITDALSLTFGDEKWRTKTLYEGDRTTVILPKGGTATTTVTDARGRTTELLQYTDAARTASPPRGGVPSIRTSSDSSARIHGWRGRWRWPCCGAVRARGKSAASPTAGPLARAARTWTASETE
ncbi:hypothetical protein OG893_00260 [Streptomyces sp. NBC_01696]